MEKLASVEMNLFEGAPGLWPSHNMSAIRSRSFKMAGKMIAHSIIQSHVGFIYLSEALYVHIAKGDDDEAIASMTIDDMVDSEDKCTIMKVYSSYCNVN